MTSPGLASNLRLAKRVAALGITVIAGLSLWGVWQSLPADASWLPENVRWWGFGIAALLGMVQLWLASLCFRSGFSGGSLALRHAPGVFLVSQLAKYVPGRVWAPVLQRFILGQATAIRELVSANVLVVVCLLLAQILGFAACAAFFMGGWVALIAVAIGGPALVLMVMDQLAQAAANIAGGYWRDRLGSVNPIRIVAWAVLLSVSGAAAWVSLYSLWLGYSLQESLALYGVSAAAIVMGLASALPAGLGVREAAFVWLEALPWPLPATDMITVAIQGRVWLLSLDMASAALGFAWLWCIRNPKT